MTEQLNAYYKAWRAKNVERVRAYRKRRYTENRAAEMASSLDRYHNHPQGKEASRRWLKKNKVERKVAKALGVPIALARTLLHTHD